MAYTVAELKALLREAEERERNLGKAELAALPRSFEWRVTQQPFGFRVECRLDAASRQALEEWKQAFPNTLLRPVEKDWHGMSYHLLYTVDGLPVLLGGGGSVILALPNRFGLDPVQITEAQAQSFRDGRVPDELKKGW